MAGWEVAASILIPIFAFGLNWAIRAHENYVLSAAADFVLAIMAFDLAAIAGHETFTKLVGDPSFQRSFVTMFLVFFIATAACWYLVSLPLEHRLSKGYSFEQKRYLRERPTGVFVTSWALVAAVLTGHLFPFFYR
jgi:hypothetical protein